MKEEKFKWLPKEKYAMLNKITVNNANITTGESDPSTDVYTISGGGNSEANKHRTRQYISLYVPDSVEVNTSDPKRLTNIAKWIKYARIDETKYSNEVILFVYFILIQHMKVLTIAGQRTPPKDTSIYDLRVGIGKAMNSLNIEKSVEENHVYKDEFKRQTEAGLAFEKEYYELLNKTVINYAKLTVKTKKKRSQQLFIKYLDECLKKIYADEIFLGERVNSDNTKYTYFLDNDLATSLAKRPLFKKEYITKDDAWHITKGIQDFDQNDYLNVLQFINELFDVELNPEAKSVIFNDRVEDWLKYQIPRPPKDEEELKNWKSDVHFILDGYDKLSLERQDFFSAMGIYDSIFQETYDASIENIKKIFND